MTDLNRVVEGAVVAMMDAVGPFGPAAAHLMLEGNKYRELLEAGEAMSDDLKTWIVSHPEVESTDTETVLIAWRSLLASLAGEER